MYSNFYAETHVGLGLSKPRTGIKTYKNVVSVLRTREIGKTSPYTNFTFGSKCRVYNKFLPNKSIDLDIYEKKVFCGIFNKDGSRFLTAAQDNYLRLYKSDDVSYKQLNIFETEDVGWSIIDIAFTPDQKSYAYSTWSNNIHICPLDGDPSKMQTLDLLDEGRRLCIFSIAFSGDNREVLGSSNEGYLYVLDRERNIRAAKIRAHHYDANCVTYSDESSNIIYTAGDDGMIKVWDRRTLRENPSKPVGTLVGHLDGITFLDSKRDGRYLISNSKDQSIKLWDIRRFVQESDARRALITVDSMNWDYRWQEIPLKLKKFDRSSQLPYDTSVMTYRGHTVTKTLIRCRFSPAETTGQQYIYTGGGNGNIVVYNALTGEKVVEYRDHLKCVRDVHWHPKFMEFVSSSWDHNVRRWIFYHRDMESERLRMVNGYRRRSIEYGRTRFHFC